MKKSISKIGQILNKEKQQTIKGGIDIFPTPECYCSTSEGRIPKRCNTVCPDGTLPYHIM